MDLRTIQYKLYAIPLQFIRKYIYLGARFSSENQDALKIIIFQSIYRFYLDFFYNKQQQQNYRTTKHQQQLPYI